VIAVHFYLVDSLVRSAMAQFGGAVCGQYEKGHLGHESLYDGRMKVDGGCA